MDPTNWMGAYNQAIQQWGKILSPQKPQQTSYPQGYNAWGKNTRGGYYAARQQVASWK